MTSSSSGAPQSAAARSLTRHATELYDDERLTPMLRQLIRTSCRLGDAVGGSVSLVDPTAGQYTKVAEIGTACRLGQSFSLDEGVTGAVMRRRAPVALSSYAEISTGHLTAGHPAWSGAVVAVPVWWKADIVAVNVVFAGSARVYSTDEIDELEMVTQVVAAGLVTAVEREMPDRSIARPAGWPDGGPGTLTVPPPGGVERAVASVRDVVDGLREVTRRADTGPGRSPLPAGLLATGMELRIVTDTHSTRLLLRRDPEPGEAGPRSASAWHELVDQAEGGVRAVPVTGPDAVEPASASPATDPSPLSPLTAREAEVAALLGRGLSDRAIAAELCLSPKTVEKHVSAVLRKTETSSRTAAVVLCLEMGWL